MQYILNTWASTALTLQAEAHVLRVLYEALHQASTANSLTSQYPDTWSPQSTANTELFEVNLNSLEARPLVQALQAAGATVVKACALHSAYALCALHSALCTLRSALCDLHSGLCTLRSALCALHSAHQHTHCSSVYIPTCKQPPVTQMAAASPGCS